MARPFTYTIKTKPVDLLRIVNEKLRDQKDIEFSGDEKSGHIEGKGFKGTYEIVESSLGSNISLTITKKPLIAPWALVKAKIDAEAKNW